MLKNINDLTSQDFSKGLNTISDIFNVGKEQSPDMMDVKVNFDGSIQKRLGNTTMNTVAIGGMSLTGFADGTVSLQTNLAAYYKLNEASGTRSDEYGSLDLTEYGNVGAESGKIGQGASFVSANTSMIYHAHNAAFSGTGEFTIGAWFYLTNTGDYTIASKMNGPYPYGGIDGKTVLALHCDGADASTTFTDVSGTPKTVTALGNCEVDTDQTVFGIGSAKFDGTGDYLYVDDHADLDFSTGDYTVDFWVRFSVTPSGATKGLLDINDGSSGNGLAIQWYGDALRCQVASVTKDFAWSPVKDVWYHVAVARSSSNMMAFVDGSQIGSTLSSTHDINGTSGAVIGRSFYSSYAFHTGWIDEVRISKGIARWTSNFTKPAGPYSAYSDYEYRLFVNTDNILTFRVSSDQLVHTEQVKCNSFGALSTATWYHAVAWYDTSGIIGVGVNMSCTTDNTVTGGVKNGSAGFAIGGICSGNELYMNGRVDEVGFWNKALTLTEIKKLYSGTTGNTYDLGSNGYTWGGMDFGATNKRWFVVAAGTGVYASSDLGINFITIATDRTSNYQSFERSKNSIICTSDSYDNVLYWYGSGGTYSAWLSSNATASKYAVNYQGYLILLNTLQRKRQFLYNDESTQIDGRWENSFDLPSSADDEITGAFVLRRRLYISTKYKLFRLSYIGGNPDWAYQDIKDFGFVPRTIKRITLKNVGEVVIGMSWDRRIRLFDGTDDKIISDNVENDNKMCDFALSKISQSGSGLFVSNAEMDKNTQTYKLCVALGENSQNTTHMINFDGRVMAFYPYSNQEWQFMAMAESDNKLCLLAGDRSGYIHRLDTINKDVATPVNEHFSSTFLFDKSPSQTSKGHKIDLFLSATSSNTLYYLDRKDFSDTFKIRTTINIVDTDGLVQIHVPEDIPETSNVYQYQLTSSSGTSEPWKLNRVDYFTQGMGIGKYNTKL